MLSKEEVQHIAKLARLGLTSKEITRFKGELSSILNYVEKLKEIDVSEVPATSHPLAIENVMREDEINAKRKTQSAKLLDLVPETKAGFIKVKSVFR